MSVYPPGGPERGVLAPVLPAPVMARPGYLAPYRDPVFRGCFQQASHRWAFVDEDSDVALWLGQGQSALQRHKRSREVTSYLVGERLQQQGYLVYSVGAKDLGSRITSTSRNKTVNL